ncbi:MAG: hypothetical protein ACO36I_14900 [Candidatus Latescibacterota bacterium]
MPDDQLINGLATDGRKVVAQTQRILMHIGQSTETAWGELFEALNVSLTDQKISQPTKDALHNMMNALQFHDVVAQQLAAAKTILTTFDEQLSPFANAPDEADLEVSVAGAFDATASFDRERVDVDDLDAWIQEAKDESDKS